jgi:general secretion pathway protein A
VIPPLSAPETRAFIRHRLEVAGAHDLGLFTDRALDRIAAYAKGVPRVINLVCEHCMLIGYAEQHRRIDADVVARATRYLEAGLGRPRAPWRWRRWLPSRRLAWAAATPVLLGLAALPALPDQMLATVPRRVTASLASLLRVAWELLPP